MPALKATEVFKPSDFPTHTYVDRPQLRLEERLMDALATPGEVVSVAGPSKSGKTVLIEKVVGLDNLIVVTGSGIKDVDSLWGKVLDWMGAPTSTTQTSTTQTGTKASVSATGGAGVFGLIEAKATGSGELTSQKEDMTTAARGRAGIAQIVKEIGGSDYTVLIDDFHYMSRETQAAVAKEIKEATRQGIKIITASVPHRADDVVRSNPELRGRVRIIDLAYWTPADLTRIAEAGFPKLGLEIDAQSVQQFATEASGSPQLMQAICLQTCFDLKAREARPSVLKVVLDAAQRRGILEETSTRTDFGSLVRNMHTGPKTRGNERKEFVLVDGSEGDVYRCVLMALAADPPSLGFSYNDISQRIQRVCAKAELPQAASIYGACSQMSDIALNMYPEQRVLEWAADDSRLDIIDPYFLFYVRWSSKIAELRAKKA